MFNLRKIHSDNSLAVHGGDPEYHGTGDWYQQYFSYGKEFGRIHMTYSYWFKGVVSFEICDGLVRCITLDSVLRNVAVLDAPFSEQFPIREGVPILCFEPDYENEKPSLGMFNKNTNGLLRYSEYDECFEFVFGVESYAHQLNGMILMFNDVDQLCGIRLSIEKSLVQRARMENELFEWIEESGGMVKFTRLPHFAYLNNLETTFLESVIKLNFTISEKKLSENGDFMITFLHADKIYIVKRESSIIYLWHQYELEDSNGLEHVVNEISTLPRTLSGFLKARLMHLFR